MTATSPSPFQAAERPRAPTPLSSFYPTIPTSDTPTTLQTARPSIGSRSFVEPVAHPPQSSASDAGSTVESSVVRTPEPFLGHAFSRFPEPPVNPRDHSVLEFVYNEMHASRFINLEPLSLLGNSLTLHFKGTMIIGLVLVIFSEFCLFQICGPTPRFS